MLSPGTETTSKKKKRGSKPPAALHPTHRTSQFISIRTYWWNCIMKIYLLLLGWCILHIHLKLKPYPQPNDLKPLHLFCVPNLFHTGFFCYWIYTRKHTLNDLLWINWSYYSFIHLPACVQISNKTFGDYWPGANSRTMLIIVNRTWDVNLRW